MGITVKEAKAYLEEIKDICDEARRFYKSHGELGDELLFLQDAVAYLSDYRVVLENAIENALIDIGLF